MSPEARPRRKLYGRRMGPKLSAQQVRLVETLLPQLRLAPEPGRDPRSYFPKSVSEVWLEIGFGAGEHVLWQAEHHPEVGIIGAEPYVSGIAKLLSRVATSEFSFSTTPLVPLSPLGGEGLGEGASPRVGISQSETPPLPSPLPRFRGRGENIRLYDNDARDILDALPDASLARVFILFPDPWPKTRHHKRRLIQMDTLDALARVMREGAELRFASDDADYLNWTLERLMAHPAFAWTATRAQDWQSRAADWPQTRYEAKALHGVPAFLRFVRI